MEFKKYFQRGAYHWQQISRSPIGRKAFVVGRYRNMMNLVKSHAGGCAGRQLLDVGCGDGVLSWMFAASGAKVTGVDILPLALDYARRETVSRGVAVEFLEADSCSLPFVDCSFDAAVSSDTIEHVAAPLDLLREMRRVLKTGGWAVISTPVRLTCLPLDVMHVQEWFAEEFVEMAGQVMPGGQRFESHPVFWMELTMRHRLFDAGINLASLVWNPFDGFSLGFRHQALQYWVWRKPHEAL
jgi:ubiquinone/menaquinone biosynthesis C-methylase UbiE